MLGNVKLQKKGKTKWNRPFVKCWAFIENIWFLFCVCLYIYRLHEWHPPGSALPTDGEWIGERRRPWVEESHQQVSIQQSLSGHHLPQTLHMPRSLDAPRVPVSSFPCSHNQNLKWNGFIVNKEWTFTLTDKT